ncbi:hypothetical protein [Brevundimonas sp. M20]|nr:hypothetical protein [Brevundimonas sp. M20]
MVILLAYRDTHGVSLLEAVREKKRAAPPEPPCGDLVKIGVQVKA